MSLLEVQSDWQYNTGFLVSVKVYIFNTGDNKKTYYMYLYNNNNVKVVFNVFLANYLNDYRDLEPTVDLDWTADSRGARRNQASDALLLLLVLVKYYKISCLILLYTLFTFLQRKLCWVLFSLVLYWLKFSVLSHIQLLLCFSCRCKFGTISSFMLTCEFKIVRT